MASLSELVDYAKAKQPRNGLAEVAGHFIEGASSGYDAGLKAKSQHVEEILKSAQALEANEKARALKVQNDLWQGFMDDAKLKGKMPLTPGETSAGRSVANQSLGDASQPSMADMASRIKDLFKGDDGTESDVNVTLNLPGGMGHVTTAKKPGSRGSNPLAAETEDRIVWDKASTRALQMAQAENPMAGWTDAKKYLRIAFETLGKDPNKYIKNTDLTPPPAPADPWGLLKGQKPAAAQ